MIIKHPAPRFARAAVALGGPPRVGPRRRAPSPADTIGPKPDPKIEKQVADVLQQLTLEEKIGLCSGDNGNFRGVPRLNIPDLMLTDGPRGRTIEER